MPKLSDLYVVAGIYAVGLYALHREGEQTRDVGNEEDDRSGPFAVKGESLILLLCTLIAGDQTMR